MTLRVRKVLHVEKSLYQDVLVFESETYGNVLLVALTDTFSSDAFFKVC